tara:strand:- start:609 stop:1376 length:768 start_codon:yes stop_codon:yes gene_type:complete
MSDSDLVLSEVKDGIRIITLNRPDILNAVNQPLIKALLEAARDANNDEDTRCVVLRGAGRAFCAGFDLSTHNPDKTYQEERIIIDKIQAITRELVLGNKIIIGAIHGWAVGAGLEWAINCDLAVWGQSTRAFFPELEWGLFVTGAVSAIAPRQISLSHFKELVLLREKVGAPCLHELGLAWRVVPDEEVFDHAMSVAQKVAELPPDGVIDFKRITNRAAYSDIETAMAMETEATIRGALAPAAAEEIKKFADRKG